MDEGQPAVISQTETETEREPGLSCIIGDTDSHSPAQPAQDSDGEGAAN